MQEKISVIIPVYNVEPYLRRCVDSVLGQTYSNLEVILVDDGSPDGCGAICDEYAGADQRVQVIHKPNGGLSSARNRGLDSAAGEYITFVDSDDFLEPDTCRKMLEAMGRYNADIVCVGNWNVNCQTGEKTLGVCPEREACITGEEMAGRMFTWDGCDSAVCDKLFRRALFESRRFPEGKVCEDVAITYRIVLDAERVALLKDPLYNYLHRPGSISNSALSDRSFDFSEHTAVIYDYIRRNHPAITPQAEYLRVRSLENILLLWELAPEEKREKYTSRCRSARRELRRHLGFALRYPLFSRRDRARDILLAAGAYRALRPIFTHDKRNTQ